MDELNENQQQGPEEKKPIEKIALSIVIAEDTLAVSRTLKILLGKKYSSVEVVEDGELLIKKLSTSGSNVDFIITDNSMPNLTGIEAIKKIRAMGGNFETIPIILYTTDSGSLQKEAEAMGAVFLSKPAKIDILYDTIEKLRQEKSNP